MKKRILLIFVVCLFLLACTGLRRSGTGAPQTYEFHTGSQGLVMNFIPGAPPDRIYEGDPLSLLVEFSNKGAVNIEDGRLYISGYDKEFVHLSPLAPPGIPSFRAEGKSYYNPAGTLSTIAEYYDPRVSMPDDTDVFTQAFKVTACYRYRTEAAATVCLDPDPFSLRPEDKVCVARDTNVGPAGAPVAVTYVQQTSTRDRVQFRIGVQNVGGGLVLTSDKGYVPLNQCHTGLGRDQINKVEISAFLSGEALTCEPAQLRLVNGQGSAFCFINKRVDEAYQTVLNIYLDYGYRDSISRQVQVLRLPGSDRTY